MLSIRFKLLLVVIPLLTVSLILLTILSIGFARTGITKVATEFLGYKMNEIVQKATNEMENLDSINFEIEGAGSRVTFVEEIKNSISLYAASITKQNIESFMAIDSNGVVKLSTDSLIKVDTQVDFFDVIKSSESNWIKFKSNGIERVGFKKYFEEWDYFFLLSVFAPMFYKDANIIVNSSLFMLIVSIVVMGLILFFTINYILKPLKNIVSAMNEIIRMNDFSNRVEVQFNDEIGEMAFTFNNMLTELEGAYNTIKEYAYQSVLAQKKEERIKLMFQKYVPQDVVNEIVHNPDSALVGKNANVTVLFSDIRSFTTISESMEPETLVESLNRYFTVMVDIIYKRKGVIDKYIGDAIMAIFGAPKEYGDDVQQAVLAGLEMVDNLERFNEQQRKLGLKEFKIGIGVNYGPVTVGNIGTSQKMDYTVIGDAVNLASRLEGLTKEYRTTLIISEGTYMAVKDFFYVREIDRVRVKGKLKPVKIFQPARKLTPQQKKGWKSYNDGMKFFLERQWDNSEKCFKKAIKFLENNDYLSELYLETIEDYRQNPPDEDWDGTRTMTHK
ncbi:MAG: HAMP domain-containing protein [Spirochaetes bacterium]|nr:HAMP domain-containing protein [Spirochaetota bacterium]